MNAAILIALLLPQIPPEPAEIAGRLTRATVWIRTPTQGVGTGWIVDAKRRWLITNLHVVGEQERVEAFFAVELDGRFITERQYYLENQKSLHEQGHAVRGKVIARREKSDLALIELEQLPKGSSVLPLAELLPGPGKRVHSVGHRHDSEALWNYSNGEVRQVGKLTEGYFWRGKKLAADVPSLLVQLPINTGDSGSALVNHYGQVVGVISGVRWQAPVTAIAVQFGEVRALLSEAQRKQPLPARSNASGTELYRKLLAATCWVRPTATEGRTAGWVIDKEHKLIVTTASGAGSFDLVDVVFPQFANNELIPEANAYSDRIALRQNGELVRGLVLMRDVKRDLALIELESLPKNVAALSVAKKEPLPAEKIHVVSHPNGVELHWLYSTGVVRQSANIELVNLSNGEALKSRALLLQIPHQAASSGGPVVDDRGELVGMMAAKEGAQQQLGYAIAVKDLQAFVKIARPLFAPETGSEYLRRGKWLLAHGQFLAGDDALWNALIEPSDDAAIREGFDAYIQAREFRAARAWSIFLNRKAEPARFAIASAISAKSDQARELADEILKMDPKCAMAYLARGMVSTGKKALADLDEAIFCDPNLVEAYRQRAWANEKLDDDSKGLADWSRAIELYPYCTEPLWRRARLYLRTNQPKRAVADYERLIELLPTDAEAHRSLAGAWLVQGDEAKAIPSLVAALRWQPSLRKSILKDLIEHGHNLAKRWPDDTSKKAKWYESALSAIRGPWLDPNFRKQVDDLLTSRKKDWDDLQWGEALEKALHSWIAN